MRPWLAVGALVALAAFGAEPSFSDYPAAPLSGARAKAVDLSSHPDAPRFRTRLREGFAAGPNFAGSFTIVTWGCGTSCAVLALIDQKTGRVFISPKVPFASWAGWRHDDYGFKYEKDSSLLFVAGQVGPSESYGRYYFNWTGSEFTLVQANESDRGTPPNE
jgi:hypothetical protein